MEIELETTITRSKITNNVATATGGSTPPPDCSPSTGLAQCNAGSAYADGAVLNQGHLTLVDSLVANNRSTATGGPHPLVEGAGITNSGSFNEVGNPWRPIPGKADIVHSVIRDNEATNFATNPFPGQADLTRVKITRNVARAVGPGSEVRGGGIANSNGIVQGQRGPGSPASSSFLALHASTVTRNRAEASIAAGGGIDNFVDPILEHPITEPGGGRSQQVVTLDQGTKVGDNTPDDCAQQVGVIAGC